MRDERTRFALAIECGNIEVALRSAQVPPCLTWLFPLEQLLPQLHQTGHAPPRCRTLALSSCPSPCTVVKSHAQALVQAFSPQIGGPRPWLPDLAPAQKPRKSTPLSHGRSWTRRRCGTGWAWRGADGEEVFGLIWRLFECLRVAPPAGAGREGDVAPAGRGGAAAGQPPDRGVQLPEDQELRAPLLPLPHHRYAQQQQPLQPSWLAGLSHCCVCCRDPEQHP